MQTNSNCLICNVRLSSNSRGCCNVFQADVLTVSSQTPVSGKLNNILGEQLEATAVHSVLICKKCLKLVNEIDAVEAQLENLKSEVRGKYDESLLVHGQGDGTKKMPAAESTAPQRKGSSPKKKTVDVRVEISQFEEMSHESTEFVDENAIDYMSEDDARRKPDVLHDITIKEDDELSDSYVGAGDEDDADAATDEEAAPTEVPEGPYKCRECEKRFLLAKHVTEHMKAAHDITLFLCDVCDEVFSKRTDLVKHWKEHEGSDQQFHCAVCKKEFIQLKQLREHLRTHASKTHACDDCGKKFGSQRLLDEHKNIHTGERPYMCTVCEKSFASKYCWKVHTKIHSVRPRPYNCQLCNKTFLNAHHLQEHEKTHSGQKNFVCETCGKAFGTARNLEVHSVVHSGNKPHTCKMCGKSFARRAEIVDHERIHTGEKPFQCELCGATFSQRSNLQSHKRATHFDDKRYKCEQCGKGFKRRRLLDYHLKSVHTGERPYKCNLCSAGFVYPEHYKKHLRIHTGEKPYKCEICGKAFNSRDNRNAHRFIHSEKKPYECKVCGQGFMRKPTLFSHMQAANHMEDTIIVNRPQLPPNQPEVVEEEEDESVKVLVSDETYEAVASAAAAAAAVNDDAPKVQVVLSEQLQPVEHVVVETQGIYQEAAILPDQDDRQVQLTFPAGYQMQGNILRRDDYGTNEAIQVLHIRQSQPNAGNSRQWLNYLNQ